MTIYDLLNHFDYYPDVIRFWDEKYNVEGKVYMYDNNETLHMYDGKLVNFNHSAWQNFLNEYGERTVTEWYYRYGDTLDIWFK